MQRETRPTIDGIPHTPDADDGDADDGEDDVDVDVDDGDTNRDVMIRVTVSSRRMYHAQSFCGSSPPTYTFHNRITPTQRITPIISHLTDTSFTLRSSILTLLSL